MLPGPDLSTGLCVKKIKRETIHIIYIFLCAILIMSYSVQADDLYYKNGCIYKNVQVVDTISSYIIFKKTSDKNLRRVPKSSVIEIRLRLFNPFVETEFLYPNKKSSVKSTSPLFFTIIGGTNEYKEEYKNPKYFPVLNNGYLKFIDSTGHTDINPKLKKNLNDLK